MTNSLRVEVYVNDVRVVETQGTYEGHWDDYRVFLTHGKAQAALLRFAYRVIGLVTPR